MKGGSAFFLEGKPPKGCEDISLEIKGVSKKSPAFLKPKGCKERND